VRWFGWALPYRWTDLHLPLDAVFRSTRANVVAFVAATHVELFVKCVHLARPLLPLVSDVRFRSADTSPPPTRVHATVMRSW
jgi:hypothetical protein